MKYYNVTGMSCAACSARVEKTVSGLEGVTSCSVNLLTGRMAVEGDVPDEEVRNAVTAIGYGIGGNERPVNDVSADKENKGRNKNTDSERKNDISKLILILAVSAVFSLAIMYISMGYSMWDWPVPAFLEGNYVGLGIIELVLSAAVIVLNRRFFIKGFKGAVHGAPNMDTLVALGSGISFVYSFILLMKMTADMTAGNSDALRNGFKGLFFESAAMILTFITVGKILESGAKWRTTDAIGKLKSLAPLTAAVLKDGKETEVPVEEIKKGDIVVIRPGSAIPCDGRVTEGSGAVNESMLTGEALPAVKKAGDPVFAGTVNTNGSFYLEAEKGQDETLLSEIIRTVEDASATKAPVQATADKVAGIFVPAVLAVSVLTFAIWMISGAETGYALARAAAVLVISCPCALGLATPVAITVADGKAAENGILFKTAEALENAGKVKTVIFDKTGTVTEGKFAVSGVYTEEGVSREELLEEAFLAESGSEHPLGKAIREYAAANGAGSSYECEFEALPGFGVKVTYGGNQVIAGNARLVFGEDASGYENRAKNGETAVYFSKNGRFTGYFTMEDRLRDDAKRAVRELASLGVKTVMITGDAEKAAEAVSEKAGIASYRAGVLPGEKADAVKEFRNGGTVMMVGDGINDAPALKTADIGTAIGAGTDIAMDSSDIVLMKSNIRDVPAVIRLSRRTLTIIKENLFWAFIYNVICIPLAAGLFKNILGFEFSPMVGSLCMSFSSFFVVTNALRINFFKIYGKGERIMKKEISIEGMMCMHCSGRVRKALEALPGVTEAQVSHETGKAVVTYTGEIQDAEFKSAVEEQGYTVTGMITVK